MRERTTKLALTVLCASVLTIASCATGAESEDSTDSVAASVLETTTTIVSSATTRPTTSSQPSAAVEVASGLVYHQGDDRFTDAEATMDVVAPTGSGPWPVVVAFHGDPASVGKAWMLPMAKDIADRGRVVFIPDWGHTTFEWQSEGTLEAQWGLLVRETRCAVAYAQTHAAEYRGDSEHITLYGYSAGGNAALMAGFSDDEPLEGCSESGPGVTPQAVVSGDGDVLLGAGVWDSELAQEPEAFYAFTPWRRLNAFHEFPVYIAAVENSYGPFDRSLGSDPAASFLADRHIDIDLVGELSAMGLLADGSFSLRDSQEWAYQALLDAGYNAEWVLLPDSTHTSLSSESRALLIDTIVHAERE